MPWTNTRPIRIGVLAAGLFMTAISTGCQSDFNGQTLPSAYYMWDDVQYFPPGPEFKLAREAAAMREAAADRVAEQ